MIPLLGRLLAARAAGVASIKAPALNLTLGSGVAAALVSAAVVFNDTYKKIFGFTPKDHPNITAALLIAVIAGYTLIAVADIIGRSIASVPRDLTHLVPAPKAWAASIINTGPHGADNSGYVVAGIRVGAAGLEYLLVKDGHAPAWVAQSRITLQLPAPS